MFFCLLELAVGIRIVETSQNNALKICGIIRKNVGDTDSLEKEIKRI
jgi:hypothetical protein